MSRTILLTRHPGIAEWLSAEGIAFDERIAHVERIADLALEAGDVVIGILPLHLAAQICSAGAACWQVTLDIPLEWRGRELSVDEMRIAGARLERYEVRQVPGDTGGWPHQCRAPDPP